MGRRARLWERAWRVEDADVCCFCLTDDAPARSHRVPWLAGWVLELQNRYPVSCWRFWFVLRRACCGCWLLAGSLLRHAGVLHLVRLLG